MTALIPPKVPWNKLRSSRKTGIEEDPIGYDYYRDDDNDDVRVVPLVCKAGRMGISRKRNEEKADTDERNSIQTALDEVAAKWSSQEDVTYLKRNEKLLEGPQIWTPKNAPPSPTLDLRSVNFDSDSLKTNKTSKSSDNNQSAKFIKAQESFAWKDPTLDKKLEELRKRAESTSSNKSFSEDRAFDKAIDSSIGSWSKLPKAPNQDVVLLKKAREEKKVKKYLEDNFTKEDRIIGENDVIYEIKREYENQDEDHRLHKMADLQPLQFKGLGPKTSDGMPIGLRSQIKEEQKGDWYKQVYNSIHRKNKRGFSNGYASEPEYSKSKSSFGKSGYSSLDRKRANDDIDCRRSPPRSPPPFSKTESRFERERRLKVGAVSDYVTGKSDCEDEDSGRLSSPPSVSSAQAKYEKDRFRVQPGRIEDYSLGRGSIASQERQRQGSGCSITRYSGAHSFNPLMSSKSELNLTTYKTPPPSINKFHMQKAIKDGYESDSNIIFRRREDKVPRPQTPVEARSAYTQIQKGGDIPVSGLRMTAPEKSKDEASKEEDRAPTPPPPLTQSDEERLLTETLEIKELEKHSEGNKIKTLAIVEEIKSEPAEQIEDLPPVPPKKSSHQRLKKWSRLIKQSLPSKNKGSDSIQSPPNTPKKEESPVHIEKHEEIQICGAKDPEPDMTTFLKERRAVSESRFRILDQRSPSPGGRNFTMAKSRESVSRERRVEIDKKNNDKNSEGNENRDPQKYPLHVGDLKQRFELKSPNLLKQMECQHPSKETCSDEKKKVKKQLKKEKKKRSRCSSDNNSDKESWIKKERKKILKKEKKEKKKKVVIINGYGRDEKHHPRKPPYPKCIDMSSPPQSRRFFTNLLVSEGNPRPPSTHSVTLKVGSPSMKCKHHRKSRSRTNNSVNINARHTMDVYLNERKIVSENKFKEFEKRKFETFPRSVSNLERASILPSISSSRPNTAMSTTSMERVATRNASSSPQRSISLPRSESAMSNRSTSLDREEYKNYVLEMVHSNQKNPRFQKLQLYYNLLDRALKLEKKSSSMEIHKLKSDEVIDFETWRSLRHKEKAKDELTVLMTNLKEAQKSREFHFRPKDVEDFRWRGDIRLRGRDKSVDHLKSHFNQLVQDKDEERKKFAPINDAYRPLWRARSVSNMASKVSDNLDGNEDDERKKHSLGKLFDESHHHKYSTTPQIRPKQSRSSLSSVQVSKIRGELNEIISQKFETVKPATPVEHVPSSSKPHSADKPNIETQYSSAMKELSESFREFRHKEKIEGEIKETKHSEEKEEYDESFPPPPPPLVEDRSSSPRTCYSLESRINEEEDEKSNFLLVLNNDNSNKEKVKTLVDNWASGDDESSSAETKTSTSTSTGFTSDSSSVRTVVFRQRSVEELRKSFDNIGPDEIGPPKVPIRTSSSFYRTRGQMLGKSFSKSSSSINEIPRRGSHFSSEKSISNPNLSSDDSGGCTVRHPKPDTKYSRAYLTLVKSGDVRSKKSKFEDDENDEKAIIQRVILRSATKSPEERTHSLVKTHETGDLNRIRRKLENAAIQRPKDKLKFFCQKMGGHSKIIGKMLALQQSTDEGTLKLANRAILENENTTVYKAGNVESKVERFETDQFGEERKGYQPSCGFSWAKRFEDNIAASSGAQKRNQFRHYYGYRPGYFSTVPRSRSTIYSRPSILPSNFSKESQGGRYTEGEVNIHYRSPVRREEKDYICEEELRKRQEQQMRKFYEGIEHKKEMQMLQDVQNRKHHDTLLPSQKSPIPLDRYEDFDGRQERIINRTRGSSHSPRRAQKLTAKALYNFQAQNPRELSFKKGDIIYIRRQIDANWYEGERNAMIGIFPLTYVELVSDSVPSTLNNRGKSVPEGQGKAKYSFQSQTPIELSLIKGEMVTLTRRIDDNWFEGRIGSRKGIFPTSYVEVICEPGESRRSISPYLKPVAAPAAHSTLKNGNILQPSYTPNFYSVQSPYSTLSRPGSSNSCHQMTTTSYTSKNIVTMDSKNDAVPFRALYNYRPQNDDEVELAEGDIVYVMEKCDDGWFVGTSQRTGVFGTFPGNYVTKV